MVRQAPSLQSDVEQRMAAKADGFGFGLLAEMRALRAEMARMSGHITKVKSQHQELESHYQKLEFHRQSHLARRQRAISTWVRDVLNKDTKRWKSKDIIYGGDVRSDAMVVTERYKKSSTEWQCFHTLYGLTPDEVNDLGIIHKFPQYCLYR